MSQIFLTKIDFIKVMSISKIRKANIIFNKISISFY